MAKEVIVPIWEKYSLTIEEAAAYFRIGENSIRDILNQNPDADYWFWNGNRKQIKRKLFEKYMDSLHEI